MCDILFILKKRDNHHEWNDSYTSECGSFSSGLYNSVKFLVDRLRDFHITSHMVEVIDNNSIDRVVSEHKPSVVVIEALWVVPEKFDILQKLHPKVKWIVRIHSEIPFLSQEGVAIGWIDKYNRRGVYVAANSSRARDSIRKSFGFDPLYLPNYYPLSDVIKRKKINKRSKVINISCFGAIRPMKNHLQQAMAAIHFADMYGKKLRFHVNGSRKEQKGDSVYRNLVCLFDQHPEHELVNCPWMNHKDFKEYIKDNIDIGMQVSFSETFNIVAADHIDMGVPVVASPEVEFVFPMYTASPTNENDIVHTIANAYSSILHSFMNRLLLQISNTNADTAWLGELFELGVRI